MSVKLAPCPFCGKEPRIAGEYDRWSVVCANYACSRGRDTASLQRDAAKLWNQQWANGLISNTLELNQTLTNECLRLKRENEKHRRKLAKRRWLHTADQADADPGHIFAELIYATWAIMWRNLPSSMRTWIVRSQMKMEMRTDRERNPELLRFLKWQDEFATKGKP